MKIIVINGKGGCGKDQFVTFCKKLEEPLDINIYNFSMISEVKSMARLIGWTGSKELKDRKFLSDLKDLLENYNDYPFRTTLGDVAFSRGLDWATDDDIFFIHSREPHDIQRWVDEHNAKTLLIRRAAVDEQHYGNHADDCVEDFEYDYVIDNNGTLEDLEITAYKFIRQILDEDWESTIKVKEK